MEYNKKCISSRFLKLTYPTFNRLKHVNLGGKVFLEHLQVWKHSRHKPFRVIGKKSKVRRHSNLHITLLVLKDSIHNCSYVTLSCVWPIPKGLTHSTDVYWLCTGQKASYMRRAGGRCVRVFSQAALKLDKHPRTLLSDLLNHWAIETHKRN